MFWKFTPPSTSIAKLLEDEDVTLKALLDDEEILQECKGQNSKLIEFLSQQEVIEDMVAMIITEPDEMDEASKYKYSNLACEILTSDIAMINNVLGDTAAIREKLFSFLNQEPPFNPLLASFFSKVIGILLTRKPEPTLEYIKNADDFLSLVLKHIGTSAIMDLLLRMVTCVEVAELRADILKWLNENMLIEKLIERIDPIYDEEIHCNCSQALCDIIRLSREHMYTLQESAQEDPLLSTLEREETVSLLLQHMFDGEINESVIVNGINVLLALLEIKRPAPFGFPEMVPELTQLDVERLARGVSKILHGLSGRLGDFHKLLVEPPKRESMQCTFGELSPPFGNTRLQVCKLLYAILVTNTHNINCQLADLKIFNILLDLFFKYEYNNFLHTQVTHCIQTVLTNVATVTTNAMPPKIENTASTENHKDTEEVGKDESKPSDTTNENDQTSEDTRVVAPLLAHLFDDCQVIKRFMEAWDKNVTHESDINVVHKKGNLGHLIVILNAIVDAYSKGANSERMKRFISDMPEEDQELWHKFLSETLSDINEKNARELGGHNPTTFSSDDDTEIIDPEFENVPFNSIVNSNSSLQQAFTEYELQQMTSNFIDQFGFPDDDFAENDSNEKFNKINNLDFDITNSMNSTPNEQLFAEVCRDRQATLDIEFSEQFEEEKKSHDHGDDEWPEQQIQYSDTANVVSYNRTRTESGDSSDSDDLIPPLVISHSQDDHMDTSNGMHGWRATFDEEIESSDSGSANSTPSSSPRTSVDSAGQPVQPAVEDNQHTNENWANFDDMSSAGVNVSVDPSPPDETPTQQPPTDRAAAYVALEPQATSDENIGSPMSVESNQEKQLTSPESEMDSDAPTTTESDQESKSIEPSDVVMEEDSNQEEPEQQQEVPEEVKKPQEDTSMDTSSATEVKRQRIDEQDSPKMESGSSSTEDSVTSSTQVEEEPTASSTAQTEKQETTITSNEESDKEDTNEISSRDINVQQKTSTEESLKEEKVVTSASSSSECEPVALTADPASSTATDNQPTVNTVQDSEVTSSGETNTKQMESGNNDSADETSVNSNGPV